MVHFGHGQLAHGIFGVFWMTAGEKDILDVAHFEEKERRKVGEAVEGIGRGDPVSCEDSDAMRVADRGGTRGPLVAACRARSSWERLSGMEGAQDGWMD